MRHIYRAGEKTFVDFSGDGIDIVDRDTGDVKEVPLFVATQGASSFTYAEVFSSQELPYLIRGHIHTYEAFEGVTKVTVPDNARTDVTDPCYYEPEINRVRSASLKNPKKEDWPGGLMWPITWSRAQCGLRASPGSSMASRSGGSTVVPLHVSATG